MTITQTPIAAATLRFCRECEERIPLKRLQARPDAVYCRDCQEQYDTRPTVSLDASVVMAEMDVRPLEVEFRRGIREFVGRERPAPFVKVPVEGRG